MKTLKRKFPTATATHLKNMQSHIEADLFYDHERSGFTDHRKLANKIAILELIEADMLSPIISTFASLAPFTDKRISSSANSISFNALPKKLNSLKEIMEEYIDEEDKFIGSYQAENDNVGKAYRDNLEHYKKTAAIQNPLKPLNEIVRATMQDTYNLGDINTSILETYKTPTLTFKSGGERQMDKLRDRNLSQIYTDSVASSEIPFALKESIKKMITQMLYTRGSREGTNALALADDLFFQTMLGVAHEQAKDSAIKLLHTFGSMTNIPPIKQDHIKNMILTDYTKRNREIKIKEPPAQKAARLTNNALRSVVANKDAKKQNDIMADVKRFRDN